MLRPTATAAAACEAAEALRLGIHFRRQYLKNIHTNIGTSLYVYVCINERMNVSRYVCMYGSKNVSTYACMYVCIYACIYVGSNLWK